MTLAQMIQMRLFFHLVSVHSHVLSVRIILLDRPAGLLCIVDPVLKPVNVTLRRLCNFFLIHLVGVKACHFLLKLAVHVLPAEPMLLSTTRQGLATIDTHNMPSHLSCTIQSRRVNIYFKNDR